MGYYQIDEKSIGRVRKLLILLGVPVMFALAAILHGFVHGTILDIPKGFLAILLSPTILSTDFLEVGGMEAAMLNAAILATINLAIMNHYRLKVNGGLLAAFFTVLGFSFFGKNLFNILPIYLGGFLYTRYQKISFKDVVVVIMFATSLAPIISEISFAGFLSLEVGIPVAILVGVFIGFIIVPLTTHMVKFHDGYNLYNIGFTAGIVGTVLTSLLRSFGVTVEPVSILASENNIVIVISLVLIFTGLMILGLVINPKAMQDYPVIFTHKGRLYTDFTFLLGYGITYLNMSVMGFASLAYVFAVGGIVNGPVLAAILMVTGFAALGKHPKNCYPIVLGAIAAALFFRYDLSSTGILISVLFSTTLAPLAGRYGVLVGFCAGFIHMVLVTNVGVIHGGVNLYNNGFSGGIVASVMLPIIDAFKKEKRNAA